MLANATSPVAVGIVDPAKAAQWDSGPLPQASVSPVPGTSKATVTFPDSVKLIRLDFELAVKIGSNTATCLAFHQLFSVAQGGSLAPTQYSFDKVDVRRGPASAPPHAPVVAASGRRSFVGGSPLVGVTPDTVTVNCEFLDVTELWWGTWAGRDDFGWYLNPAFGARPERLRVLAWTSGTAPMLWFVSVSDRALDGTAPPVGPDAGEGAATGADRPGADIVFFRAPAGFNAFFYTPDEKGFLAPLHGTPTPRHLGTTMSHLARWLLTPQPPAVIAAELARTGGGGPPFNAELMGRRLVPATVPPPRIAPADPIDLMTHDFRWAFRPVGVEEALRRAPAEDIAIMPLSFDGFKGPFAEAGGYQAFLKPDTVEPVLRSVWDLLWMRNAVHAKDTATPRRNRQAWILGNSAANRSVAAALTQNPAAFDRMINCDATPKDDNLIPVVLPAIKKAKKAREDLKKPFRVVMVTTPNMWPADRTHTEKANFLAVQGLIKATGATVAFLPDDAEWDAYWTYPPTAASNPLLFDVLSAWDKNGLTASKRFGTGKNITQWLFWHEWSVDGGHLDTVPGSTPAVGPPSPPTQRVRGWLEDIVNIK
ncbi:MAG: hypothetical protein HOQ24_13710 [Mycobacteriaceae bacterium]|nr:hypothetical protein [Mycobacteriaceae bacterium]